MSYLELKNISKYYGYTMAVKDLSLKIEEGEFVVFLGPSGCGKTTILRMIAGLEDITVGEIFIDGINSTNLFPKDRQIAMVFQSYALYPHMTVEGNLCYGLRSRNINEKLVQERLQSIIVTLNIKKELLSRHIPELSGGERQRVAIGRALMKSPKLFLFDEPLANLDAALRNQMKQELIYLHKKLKNTMIFVTHDQHEAMTMATKIGVFNNGVIEQFGTPLEIFHKPVNKFVASFIGSPKMNFFQGEIIEIKSSTVQVKLSNGKMISVKTEGECSLNIGDPCEIGIRPFSFYASSIDDSVVSIHISIVEMLGDTTIVYGNTENGQEISAKLDGHIVLKENTDLHLAVHDMDVYLFDKDEKTCTRSYFPE